VQKKGIELSVNFLVVLIISIVIFGFGARFIYTLASEATGLSKLTLDELDKRIGELFCEGSDKVCLGIDRKVVRKGELGVFGLRLINVLDSQEFTIVLTKSKAFDKEGTEITSTDNKLIYFPKDARPIDLKRNEEGDIGFGIEVPKNAVSGTYIFDINIEAPSLPAPQKYTNTLKIYVEVP